MSRSIKTYDGGRDASSDADFDAFFPELILTLRDSSLEFVIDGREVSPDQYLNEYCLKAKEGNSEQVQRYNEPRLFLRKYFKRRKCFAFERPTTGKKLKDLENLTDADLDEDFVKVTKLFLDYVYNSGRPMQLNNGTPVTGRMYVSLAKNYTSAIREGAVPCIQSALRSMAVIENEAATKEAFNIYRLEMQSNVVLPTESKKSLHDIHLRNRDKAFNHFLGRRVLDDDNVYHTKLDQMVNDELKVFQKKNEDESQKRCEVTLKKLHGETITAKMNAGVYAVSGGHRVYCQDRDQVKQQYDATLNLGVMKEETFVTYVENMAHESETLLKSDETISEKERQLQLERDAKRRAEEKESMIQNQLQETQDAMKEERKQREKEIAQIREAHVRERKNEIARMDEVNEKRIQEVSRLQEEKLTEVQNRYEKEMEESMKAQTERSKQQQETIDRMLRAESNRMLLDTIGTVGRAFAAGLGYHN